MGATHLDVDVHPAPNSAEERRRASLYAVLQGGNVAERRELLDALGLLPARLRAEHGMPGYRAGCKCKTCRRANANRNRRQRAAHRGEQQKGEQP